MAHDKSCYFRLRNGLDAFLDALKAHRPLDKHHQFVRAIESFLPPSVFGMDDFSKFAGRLLQTVNCENNEDVLKQMYDLRSVAEHHRLFNSQKLRNVANPEIVADKLTRQAEAFARELFQRFLCSDRNFLKYFADEKALQSFWFDDHGSKLKNAWGNPLFDIHAIT